MRIVVTGGAGAVGRHVVGALAGQRTGGAQHELTVLDAAADTGRPGGVDPDGVRQVRADIRDLGQVYGVLNGADAVIHLAAVRRPGIVPDDVLFATNVLGTFNVHEAAWRSGVGRVVTVSSEAALGWDYRIRDFVPDYLPIDEDHPARPQDAYGLSKVAGEAIVRSYAGRGLETVALRAPWVALPDAFERLVRERGRRLTRFATASYVHVDDLAEACRLAVEAPAAAVAGGPVLFAVADDTSIDEPLCTFLPRMLPAIGELAAGLTGSRPAVSNRRARALLGWQPLRSWRQPPAGGDREEM